MKNVMSIYTLYLDIKANKTNKHTRKKWIKLDRWKKHNNNKTKDIIIKIITHNWKIPIHQ